jgi:hypothetical protein
MNRRSFLQSILAVGIAPAVVRAESLMKMVRRESGLVVPSGMELMMAEEQVLIERVGYFFDLKAEMLRELEASMARMYSVTAVPRMYMFTEGTVVLRLVSPSAPILRISPPSSSAFL